MRRVAFAVMSTVAGLVGLLSYKTHDASFAATTATTASGTSVTVPATSGSGSSGTSSGTLTGSGTSTGSGMSMGSAKTVTGSVIDTQYGPVQVRITVRNGVIASATAVEYPSGDPRSQQINAYAVPILQQETVGKKAVSSVDMVSGATHTSTGYLQSLQSAIDKAGI